MLHIGIPLAFAKGKTRQREKGGRLFFKRPQRWWGLAAAFSHLCTIVGSLSTLMKKGKRKRKNLVGLNDFGVEDDQLSLLL